MARERVDTPLGARETLLSKHEPSDSSASQQLPSEGSGRIQVQPALSRDRDSPAPQDPSSSQVCNWNKEFAVAKNEVVRLPMSRRRARKGKERLNGFRGSSVLQAN